MVSSIFGGIIKPLNRGNNGTDDFKRKWRCCEANRIYVHEGRQHSLAVIRSGRTRTHATHHSTKWRRVRSFFAIGGFSVLLVGDVSM